MARGRLISVTKSKMSPLQKEGGYLMALRTEASPKLLVFMGGLPRWTDLYLHYTVVIGVYSIVLYKTYV